MSNKETIVVRLRPNHPTGSRRRAGFVFGTKPTAVEVTAEEKKLIEEDQCLMIITKGSAIEQATKQTKSSASTGPVVLKKDDLTKKQIAEMLTEMKVEFNERANKDELFAVLEEAIANAEKSSASTGDDNLEALSVEEIIAKLEEKGLVEGTDFVKDADKADLIELLLA